MEQIDSHIEKVQSRHDADLKALEERQEREREALTENAVEEVLAVFRR